MNEIDNIILINCSVYDIYIRVIVTKSIPRHCFVYSISNDTIQTATICTRFGIYFKII